MCSCVCEREQESVRLIILLENVSCVIERRVIYMSVMKSHLRVERKHKEGNYVSGKKGLSPGFTEVV